MFKLLVQIRELSGEATDDIITVGAHFQKSVREVRELLTVLGEQTPLAQGRTHNPID